MELKKTDELIEFKIVALYNFTRIDNCQELRDTLVSLCESLSIVGGLIIASEGINGTLAGKDQSINSLISEVSQYPRFSDLSVKYSVTTKCPFYRLRIRISPEIISMGVSMDVMPSVRGVYINPLEWDDFISSPDVTLVDTRNDYEIEIGSFEGAINPRTKCFGEFPDFVDSNLPSKSSKIAMFCTGGIRCEKASAYLMSKGFENVYQLKGGILKYLEEVPVDKSLWKGQCYVFDQRVSVGHGLIDGDLTLCRACRHVLSPEDVSNPSFKEGVHCSFCVQSLTDEVVQANEERHRQMKLADMNNRRHLGMKHKR